MILGKSLTHTAMHYPDKPAIIFEGQSWTHRELLSRVQKMANALTAAGYAQGDRIAVLGRNSHWYLELSFALALNGICMVPINHRLKPAEVAMRLTHAEVSGIFLDPEFEAVLAEIPAVLARALAPRTIIMHAIEGGARNYERIMESGEDTPPNTIVSPEDPLYLGYTSGTTGRAKAAIVSHRAIVVGMLYKTLQYRFDETGVSLNPGYFWHSAPRDFAQLQIYLGGTTVVMREFDAEECLSLIERHGVTTGFYVPTMFSMMLEAPGFDRSRTASMQTLISGGAPLPTGLKNDVLEKFGAVLHEFYAATETRIIATITPEELRHKTRSVGRPVRDVEVRIMDTEGRTLPMGETGEIYIRTPTLFSGYYNDPEKTAAAFQGDWFSLGDMGRLDDDGYLYLVDRRTDMVISGGENIYPSEVEDVLQQHPAISDVAVIGVPDPKWGETLKAIICLRPGQSLSEQELRDYCAANMADYLKPRSYEFVDELPRNPTGKILKRVLRDPYWASAETKV